MLLGDPDLSGFPDLNDQEVQEEGEKQELKRDTEHGVCVCVRLCVCVCLPPVVPVTSP